jgi:histidine ammonia-lyase
VITVDGTSLTCDEVVRAASGGEPVELAASGRERAEASYQVAAEIATQRPVYGRSTGVGANRSVSVGVSGHESAAHASALLRSHATSAGPRRSDIRTRAMLVVRLNQLASGGSGANPAVLDGLAEMIRTDALPTIREHGGVGTGDLSALATTALAMTEAGVPFTAHDALPFMSSNAATIGDAALAAVGLDETARAAIVVAALTFAAIDGNGEAFSAAVDRVSPFAGVRRVNGWLRALTASDAAPARIQDPLSLRVLPQSQGAALDALDALSAVVEAMANAPTENPVLLGDVPLDEALAHHGGFHASYLQTALDAAVLGIARAGQLNLGRLAALIEPSFTGLPAFLGDGTPGASGVMVLEYVAASALAEIRAAAVPAGLQTAVLSRGVEEDATFASLAARQALAAAETYPTLVACELVAAVRALRMQGRAIPDGLQAAWGVCAGLPDATEDRDLTADLEAAAALLPALAELCRPLG